MKETGNSSCTTLVVTPGASADGKMRVAHSCDDALADHRIVYVPAQDWSEGSKRPIYPSGICEKDLPQWNAYITPRLYVPGRKDRYSESMGQTLPTMPIGEIPQVKHTYAYLDGNYGIMNEVGLMFGECTCKAANQCIPEPGKRIFYSSELMRVALERCSKPVEAITLIGSLIEEYGYYGTGETIIIADANDAWVMEMAPTPEGNSGYWLAQQVPDGEFFVEANLFRLREVRPGAPDQMMCRRLAEEAKAEPGLDWTVKFSRGEYHHPYYSMRRTWRAMDMVAPSLNLPTKAESFLTKQPFSVKPDRPIAREDLFRIYRDHYEGTQFDLTKGAAAGPWGNPNHHRPTEEEESTGAWERAISMVDTGYAYICETGGICWLAMGRPAEVPFVPLAIAEPPREFSQGSPHEFDPDGCAWWRYNLVSQFAELRYCHAIKDIAKSQQLAEGRAALALERGEDSPQSLNRLAKATLDEWKNLFAFLAVTYDQGYYNTPDHFAQKQPANQDFLKATGFYEGPNKY